MNSQEVLKASFDAYVVLARQMKDNGQESWISYLRKAQDCLELMKANETRVIVMDQYLKAA